MRNGHAPVCWIKPERDCIKSGVTIGECVLFFEFYGKFYRSVLVTGLGSGKGGIVLANLCFDGFDNLSLSHIIWVLCML